MRTTVIGGGVVGLSCAYELAHRGADVTLLEADVVGSGASAGNAGWITPFLSAPRAAPGAVGAAVRSAFKRGGPVRIRPHLEPAYAAWVLQFLRASRPAAHQRGLTALQHLASLAPDAFDDLARRQVHFDEYRQGLAIVNKTDKNLQLYEHLAQDMAAAGYTGAVQVLRGSDVTAFDPAIKRDVAGVVHLVDERHVRPETLTQGLADALVAAGGKVEENSTAIRLRRVGSEWVVQTSQGREIVSDAVVVAAGFRSKALLRGLGVHVPLEAARGTSLTARGEGTLPMHPLKLSEDMVACSPFGDAVRLSGAFDLADRDSAVSKKRLGAIVDKGLSYLESWRPTQIDIEWVGHRPMAPDDLPIIGPVPGHAGLYAVSGHGTLGVTLGPITGRLVACELTENSPQPMLNPFRLTRFGG